jgi:D-alanyl-D-alanine carboxypeptidase
MRLFTAYLGVALTASFPSLSLAAQELGQSPQLEAVVSAAMEEFGIPGAAVGIWTSSGHWTMAAGLADVAAKRPVKLRDHFAIRSITKSFTVTIVLQLVAGSNGAVSLDDPIAKYLQGVPNGRDITLRELANMTSGLYNYSQDPAFQQAVGTDPTRTWMTDELLAFAFNDQSHPAINFPPGTQYEYSNTNTLLLGKLVELLTGRRFEDELQERILTPLQLDATSFLTGTAVPPPAATGYQGLTEDALPNPVEVSFSALGVAGAMASTLHDLGRWGRALADGSLVPADLQQQRLQAHLTAGDPRSPVYDSYGLGIGQVAGWWGHTGEGLGFEAAVFHQIDRNETFAILLNESERSDVPVTIFCRMLGVLNEAPQPDSSSVCAGGASRLNAR